MRSGRFSAPVFLSVLLLAGALAGCAAKPPPQNTADAAEADETNDPYEGANRKFYAINDTLDRAILHPVASVYQKDVPLTVRTHTHNVLSNLNNPAQLANDVMQGKPRKAGNTLMRLVLNTTAGLGGVFDVATGLGFPDHETDFGLTLALWGVPGGPFLFLPVLGPSNPRDGIGYGMNSALDPLTYVGFDGSNSLGWTRLGVGAVDGRARVLDVTDSIQKTALDPYATYRSLYQQHRRSAIDDGRTDLPATVPAWYPQARPNHPPDPETPPATVPRLAPAPSDEP